MDNANNTDRNYNVQACIRPGEWEIWYSDLGGRSGHFGFVSGCLTRAEMIKDVHRQVAIRRTREGNVVPKPGMSWQDAWPSWVLEAEHDAEVVEAMGEVQGS